MAYSNDDLMVAIGRLQATSEMMVEAVKLHIEQDAKKFEAVEESMDELRKEVKDQGTQLTTWAAYGGAAMFFITFFTDSIKKLIGIA